MDERVRCIVGAGWKGGQFCLRMGWRGERGRKGIRGAFAGDGQVVKLVVGTESSDESTHTNFCYVYGTCKPE